MNDENSLLILDDDEIFCKRLQTAMNRKGFNSYGAYSIREAKDLLKESIQKYIPGVWARRTTTTVVDPCGTPS